MEYTNNKSFSESPPIPQSSSGWDTPAHTHPNTHRANWSNHQSFEDLIEKLARPFMAQRRMPYQPNKLRSCRTMKDRQGKEFTIYFGPTFYKKDHYKPEDIFVEVWDLTSKDRSRDRKFTFAQMEGACRALTKDVLKPYFDTHKSQDNRLNYLVGNCYSFLCRIEDYLNGKSNATYDERRKSYVAVPTIKEKVIKGGRFAVAAQRAKEAAEAYKAPSPVIKTKVEKIEKPQEKYNALIKNMLKQNTTTPPPGFDKKVVVEERKTLLPAPQIAEIHPTVQEIFKFVEDAKQKVVTLAPPASVVPLPKFPVVCHAQSSELEPLEEVEEINFQDAQEYYAVESSEEEGEIVERVIQSEKRSLSPTYQIPQKRQKNLPVFDVKLNPLANTPPPFKPQAKDFKFPVPPAFVPPFERADGEKSIVFKPAFQPTPKVSENPFEKLHEKKQRVLTREEPSQVNLMQEKYESLPLTRFHVPFTTQCARQQRVWAFERGSHALYRVETLAAQHSDEAYTRGLNLFCEGRNNITAAQLLRKKERQPFKFLTRVREEQEKLDAAVWKKETEERKRRIQERNREIKARYRMSQGTPWKRTWTQKPKSGLIQTHYAHPQQCAFDDMRAYSLPATEMPLNICQIRRFRREEELERCNQKFWCWYCDRIKEKVPEEVERAYRREMNQRSRMTRPERKERPRAQSDMEEISTQKEVNVTYLDERETVEDKALLVPQNTSPAMSISMNESNWSLKQIFARPFPVQVDVWKTATEEGTTIWSRTYPGDLNRYVEKFAKHFTYFRASMKVKIMVNGTKFHSGRLMLVYRPMLTGNETKLGYRVTDTLTANPHVLLDASRSNSGELTIPWASERNYFIPQYYDLDQMLGTFQLRVFNQLRAADAVAQEVGYTIWISFHDLELHQPCLDKDLQMPVAPPSWSYPINAVAQSSSEQVKRESHPDLPRWVPNAVSNLTYGTGNDQNTILALHPGVYRKAHDAQEPSRVCEMNLKKIISIPTRVANLAWSSSLASEAMIGSMMVGPTVVEFGKIDSNNDVFYMGPMAYVARMFKYWRGSIDVKIQVIASQLHSGRISISYASAIKNEQIPEAKHFQTVILDLQEKSEVEIRCEYMSGWPWLQCNSLRKPDTTLIPSQKFVMGELTFGVLNPLRHPDNVNPSVDINVFYSAGPDFELAVVGDLYCTTAVGDESAYEVITSKRYHATAQSLGTLQSVSTRTTPGDTKISLGEKTIPSLAATHFGESFMNMKELCSRYCLVASGSLKTIVADGPYEMHFPNCPTIASRHVAFDGDGFLNRSILTHLSQMYTWWSGSLSYKIVFNCECPINMSVVHTSGSVQYPSFIPKLISTADPNRQYLHLAQSNMGTLEAVSTRQNSVEFAVPFYTAFNMLQTANFTFSRFNSTGSIRLMFWLPLGTELQFKIFQAAGPDFNLHFFQTPPSLCMRNESLRGVQSWEYDGRIPDPVTTAFESPTDYFDTVGIQPKYLTEQEKKEKKLMSQFVYADMLSRKQGIMRSITAKGYEAAIDDTCKAAAEVANFDNRIKYWALNCYLKKEQTSPAPAEEEVTSTVEERPKAQGFGDWVASGVEWMKPTVVKKMEAAADSVTGVAQKLGGKVGTSHESQEGEEDGEGDDDPNPKSKPDLGQISHMIQSFVDNVKNLPKVLQWIEAKTNVTTTDWLVNIAGIVTALTSFVFCKNILSRALALVTFVNCMLQTLKIACKNEITHLCVDVCQWLTSFTEDKNQDDDKEPPTSSEPESKVKAQGKSERPTAQGLLESQALDFIGPVSAGLAVVMSIVGLATTPTTPEIISLCNNISSKLRVFNYGSLAISNLGRMYTAIKDVINWCVEWLVAKIAPSYLPHLALMEGFSSVEEWAKVIDDVSKENYVDISLYSTTYKNKIFKLVDQAEYYRNLLIKGQLGKEANVIRDYIMRALEIGMRVRYAKNTLPVRIDPFCVAFHGASGVGKSGLVTNAAMYMMDILGYARHNRWCSVNCSEEFFTENYAQQTAVYFDDFAQFTDEKQFLKFFNLKSNNSYPLNKAFKKGDFFTSDFIFMTTNTPYPSPNCIMHKVALFRRRDALVECDFANDAVKEAFLKGQNVKRPDYSHARFRVLSAMDPKAPKGEWMDFSQIVIYLTAAAKYHLNTQFYKVQKDLSNMGYDIENEDELQWSEEAVSKMMKDIDRDGKEFDAKQKRGLSPKGISGEQLLGTVRESEMKDPPTEALRQIIDDAKLLTVVPQQPEGPSLLDDPAIVTLQTELDTTLKPTKKAKAQALATPTEEEPNPESQDPPEWGLRSEVVVGQNLCNEELEQKMPEEHHQKIFSLAQRQLCIQAILSDKMLQLADQDLWNFVIHQDGKFILDPETTASRNDMQMEWKAIKDFMYLSPEYKKWPAGFETAIQSRGVEDTEMPLQYRLWMCSYPVKEEKQKFVSRIRGKVTGFFQHLKEKIKQFFQDYPAISLFARLAALFFGVWATLFLLGFLGFFVAKQCICASIRFFGYRCGMCGKWPKLPKAGEHREWLLKEWESIYPGRPYVDNHCTSLEEEQNIRKVRAQAEISAPDCGTSVAQARYSQDQRNLKTVNVMAHGVGHNHQMAKDLINHVKTRIYRVQCVTANKYLWKSSAVAIQGRYLVFPGHFFTLCPENGVFDIYYDGAWVPIRNVQGRRHDIPNKDLTVFNMPIIFHQHRSLLHHFISEKHLPYCRSMECTLLRKSEDQEISISQGDCKAVDSIEYDLELGGEKIGEVISQESWRYDNIQCFPGDCGSLLIGYHSAISSRLLGFHICGSSQSGWSSLVTREMLEPLVNGPQLGIPEVAAAHSFSELVPEGHFGRIGTIDKSLMVVQPAKTQILKTEIYELITPHLTEPSVLSPNDPRLEVRISPLRKGIAKYGQVSPELPLDIVEIVMEDMRAESDRWPRLRTPAPLTEKESVLGIPELKGYEKLMLDTSPGWPYIFTKPAGAKGKAYLFDEFGAIDDDVLRRTLYIREKLAKRGERVKSVWIDCLKDERRPLEKIKTGSTRIFTIPPVDWSLLVRKYTMDFVVSMREARTFSFSQVGIDCQSLEWHQLYTRLRAKSPYVVAGDYTNFDGTQSPQMIEQFYCLIYYYYTGTTSPLADKDLWNILMTLAEEVIHTVHLAKDQLWVSHKGNKSGDPLTVDKNCFINSFNSRLAWIELARIHAPEHANMKSYHDHVEEVCYGDDDLKAIKKQVIDWYNQDNISKVLAQYNITYTNTQKTGTTSYLSLDDATFLKQGFKTHHTLPIKVPTMSKVTIHELLNWTRISPDQDELLYQNCVDSLRFAYFHGPEYCKALRAKIIYALRQRGRNWRIPTFLDFELWFLAKARV